MEAYRVKVELCEIDESHHVSNSMIKHVPKDESCIKDEIKCPVER